MGAGAANPSAEGAGAAALTSPPASEPTALLRMSLAFCIAAGAALIARSVASAASAAASSASFSGSSAGARAASASVDAFRGVLVCSSEAARLT